MSFSYAAEVLELIGKDHILSVNFTYPDGLNELARDKPAEVVKMAIRSHGPASAPRLKELLADIVKDEDWKDFWDRARKSLKDDPLVDLPVKRSDPICLREKHKEYDMEWFLAFKNENDMDRLLALVDELESVVVDPVETGRQWREYLADRFAFVLKGCFSGRPDMVVQTVLAAKRFGLDTVEAGGIDGAAVTKSLFPPKQFLSALYMMPARDVEP